MRALIFDGRLRFTADYPVPAPPPGEACVRVLLAGICNTDLEITQGYGEGPTRAAASESDRASPRGFRGVPGPEFVGIAEAASTRRWVGRRVVGSINLEEGVRAFARAATKGVLKVILDVSSKESAH
ncbi:MAG: alcohol dehydrogenase catalytic domain-containing protein [Planctomycetota bacterium]